ncbi:MAG: hypothetical protein E7231_14545 [Cellulosilyticum sp.]|nr:hypothetical protein [Cellulosilyticum sp.]
MKKINSINVGTKVLGIIMSLLLIIPGIGLGLKQIGLIRIGLVFIKGGLGIGGVVTVVSLILLLIELRQDRKIDAYFSSHHETKQRLSNGLYECQKCGNKFVKAEESYCKICGVQFKEYNDQPPYL